MEVSSNFGIVKELRQKHSIKRTDLAKLLGITDSYLYMLEAGMRTPSLRVVQQTAGIMKVTVDELLGSASDADDGETPDGPGIDGAAFAFIELKKKLNWERKRRLKAENLLLESERAHEHLLAVIDFHTWFEEILRDESASKNNKHRRLAKLVRLVAHCGELSFYEILNVLRVRRSILKNWLEAGRQPYKCEFVKEGQIMALTPGEAGLRLRCFECAENEKEVCLGHGREKSPDNIVELIRRLEVNGVVGREEQSRIIEESYSKKISAHEVAEIMRRDKGGIRISEGVLYLEMSKQK